MKSTQNIPNTVPSDLLGGTLWLDFVNSEAFARKGIGEIIYDLPTFVYWLKKVSAFEAGEIDSSMLHENWLDRARVFRLKLRQMAVDLHLTGKPSLPSVAMIDQVIQSQHIAHKLVIQPSGYEYKTIRRVHMADQLIGPIAESAAGFLAFADFSRFKKCADPGCELYFYDETKNNARRWCSMALCGNRQKVAAFISRKKANAELSPVS